MTPKPTPHVIRLCDTGWALFDVYDAIAEDAPIARADEMEAAYKAYADHIKACEICTARPKDVKRPGS